MARYFLSYARADGQFALRLADDLRAADVDVWVDQRDIQPSERWDRAIESALRDCAAVIVVLSPRAAASENVLDEVGYAIDHQKTVIPVLFEACDVPIRINRLQRVDFTTDYAAALERFKAVLDKYDRKATKAVLNPDVAQRAEKELAAIIGPLASKLVPVDAAQALDVSDFYRLLATHIIEPRKKAKFLENAPGAEKRPKPARPLDPEVVKRVERELTEYVGPIAAKLVEAAVPRCRNAGELYRTLGAHIAGDAERMAFLKNAPPHSGLMPAVVFSRAELEAVIRELTTFLGPISRHVVERDAKQARNADDLYERVAGRIPNPEERATFLKRLRGSS